MAFQLMKGAKFVEFLKNETYDPQTFTSFKVWAGLPKDESNVSYYAGINNNKATITWDVWNQAASKAWNAYKRC